MKVLQISPTYFKDYIGGGERYPWELSKALSHYVEVTLVVFGNQKIQEKISKNFIVKKYRAITSMPPFCSKTNPFPLSLSFLREIEEVDIVHIHQFNTLVANLSILYARAKHKIVCVTDHAGGIFKLSKILPVIGKAVNLYLLDTNYSYKKFDRYEKDFFPIYGGVDTDFFNSINSESRKWILFVGRIIPRKGIDYLIKAVQKLNLNLHIVGKLESTKESSEYLRLLKSLDENNRVIFKLNVDNDTLVREYNNALVTVLPSVYTDCYGKRYLEPELLGLTLLESMACGTAVICTNVGGMPEIVKDGETGFIVPPNDPNSLKEKIQYFLSHPERAEKMGKKAREVVLEKYTWDVVAKRCLKAYQNKFKISNEEAFKLKSINQIYEREFI